MADACRRFDAILLWKIDHFGRSLKHLVNSLTELAALGVAFVSLRDNLDLSTRSGRLMFLLGQPRIPVQAKRQLLKRSERDALANRGWIRFTYVSSFRHSG